MAEPTAAELDDILQRRKANAEGREIKPCGEFDQRGLACVKIAGHDGPHYFRYPGP